MNLFRSETMQYFKIAIPKTNSLKILSAIETIGKIHFVDRSHNKDKNYRNSYTEASRKCMETLSQLEEMRRRMEDYHIKLVAPVSWEEFYDKLESITNGPAVDQHVTNDERLYSELMAELAETFTRLQESTTSADDIEQSVFYLQKQLCFYKLIRDLLPDAGISQLESIVGSKPETIDPTRTGTGIKGAGQVEGGLEQTPTISMRLKNQVKRLAAESGAELNKYRLGYIAGVLCTESVDAFIRAVYRLTRGKVVVNQVAFTPDMMKAIFDPTNEETKKHLTAVILFIPFSKGDSGLSRKMAQISTVYSIKLYPLPESSMELNKAIADLEGGFKEMSNLRFNMRGSLMNRLRNLSELNPVYGCSKYYEYWGILRKYKMIYDTLNMFTDKDSVLIGSFWSALEDKDKIIDAVDRLRENDPTFVTAQIVAMTHDKVPPTKFETNDFTAPYQQIVETYSIPKYKEINPALVSTVTFPFLFGLMFGDVAHGIAFLVIALAIANINTAENPALKGLHKLRYMFIQMAVFSIFSGFVYNDFMGVKMYNSASCYRESELQVLDEQTGKLTSVMSATKKPDCVYPFGFDHIWGFSRNEITYENSFKMKFSIIVGFLQMMLGIFFRGWNAIYFGSMVDFIFEFIPQVCFMTSIFGYMCLLIVVKWLKSWTHTTPPAIISIFTSLTSVVGQS